MDQFYNEHIRQKPSDKHFKMLYNPEVRYRSRIYLPFNCALKKIKLSQILSQTMQNPDIYMRSKASSDMFETLAKFAEMR